MKTIQKLMGGFVLLLSLSALLPAQATKEPGPSEGAVQQAGAPLASQGIPVEASALVLEVFRAEHVHPMSLFDAVKRLYGRKLAVKRAEGVNLVENVAVAESAILVQDTREMSTVILEALKRLDARAAESGRPSIPKVTSACALRYLEPKDACTALQGWRRVVRQPDGSDTQNVSYVPGRAVIVLYDTAEQVAAMKAILQHLDVPHTQILISCHIIEALPDGAQDATPLAEDLLRQLSQFTGKSSFRAVGTGMVRTTTKTDRQVEMSLGTSQARHAVISFRPAAFDSAEQVLSLEELKLSYTYASGSKSGPESFTTSTVLHAGEYTLLGASGVPGIFAVLHMNIVR